MKKIFSFLCLFMAIVAMSSCSSAKEEKGTSEPEMLHWIISLSVKAYALI